MAVNRYRNHLVIYLEDKPYRGIVNGVKTMPSVNDYVIDAKPPSGGWPKVFAELEDNLKLLNDRPGMHALLLMDFDNDFESRKQNFDEILNGQSCKERVFLLGIDEKESEDLKATLQQSNNEAVGKRLLQHCPDETSVDWQNTHLRCNEHEIARMRTAGVFTWLFV
ncbi:hypothetical protein [Marinobacter persicus]|uniref:Uncharacterized protein n=1 Tax=Marinobacter persicus TaxID=930118 RepID=A0A2S6G641_9GAMM|nr:hypothetical protein [Marinobacter persicus]PPK51348.1 hypothetical protein BY455_11345 [Marinobacter persicus]PPK54601.1 hypothetical protein B0H24_101245 [Marinobacter persicus]PPK58027.1 hypothetical protein BY454_11345 [Marinobacter persicus]